MESDLVSGSKFKMAERQNSSPIHWFFRPLDELPNIEATLGGDEFTSLDILHVRPAEAAPLPWEMIVDALSLHIQYAAQAMLGINFPDLRFRIITDPHTDGIPVTHFGTLEGIVKKAAPILQKRAEEGYPLGHFPQNEDVSERDIQ